MFACVKKALVEGYDIALPGEAPSVNVFDGTTQLRLRLGKP